MKCLKCGYEWKPISEPKQGKMCPKCHSRKTVPVVPGGKAVEGDKGEEEKAGSTQESSSQTQEKTVASYEVELQPEVPKRIKLDPEVIVLYHLFCKEFNLSEKQFTLDRFLNFCAKTLCELVGLKLVAEVSRSG